MWTVMVKVAEMVYCREVGMVLRVWDSGAKEL